MVTFYHFSCQSRACGRWSREYQHGHGMGNVQPASPAGQLREIICAHQPDESRARKTPFQRGQRIAGIAGTKAGFDVGGNNPPAIGNLPRGVESRRQAAHTGGWFEWVTWRDHKPELVQAKMFNGLPCDV